MTLQFEVGPILLEGAAADKAIEIIERRGAGMRLPNGTEVTIEEVVEGQKLWRCVTHGKGPQRLPIILGDEDCQVEVLSWTLDEIGLRGDVEVN